ncbi:MAG: hypothetical protein M3Z97_06105 [Candidatus Dormibacteraeota bacterium]|nr:hypothetical protein [Candidatus Dormibacteraeota bacterium]
MMLSRTRKSPNHFRGTLPARRLAFVLCLLVTGSLAVTLFLPSPAAAASADPQLTLSVALRWGPTAMQGAWTPYLVTVKDDGGGDFTGDVVLLANDFRSDFRNTGTAGFPEYHVHVAVPRGSERQIVIYVIDPPNGYSAEARDASGKRVLARAELSNPSHAEAALGILSDLPQAEQRISAPLHALSHLDSALQRFPSAQSFPTNAAFLSGLNGIVVDQFDSASLSQAQVQALKDYVGLGGTLVEAGGPSWRRTLLPLPGELLPLRPTATATASLSSLAELGGRSVDASAQIVTGDLRGGKAPLVSSDGTPLVVEGAYGAGRVIELAFDPFGEPFDSQVSLAGLAWAQAISRALSAVQSGARPNVAGSLSGFTAPTGPGSPLAPPGVWAPGFGTGSERLFQLLQNTPVAGSPPVGLLGGLLVAYVLLCGLLNYLFLKAIGRRGLMWVTTPLIAVVFTAGAYLVGFGTRGSDFFVTQVEVQRLGPDGAVETFAFDGVFAPRKGDVQVVVPSNSLVSTAVSASSFGDSTGDASVTVGGRPQILLKAVPVWNMKAMQTLSVAHPYGPDSSQLLPLEAHLRLENGRVKGTIANRGQRPIKDLRLAGANDAQASIVAQLQPGAIARVDVDINQVRSASPGQSFGAVPAQKTRPQSGVAQDALLRLAATQAVSGRQGDLAVVGMSSGSEPVSIEGGHPSHTTLTAVVEPVGLESADAVGGAAPRARLVSSFLGDGVSQVDIYDFELPAGLKSSAALGYTFVEGLPSQSAVRGVDVFDWGSHTWQPLPGQPATGARPSGVPLSSGQTSGGTVRVRVRESEPGQANLVLNDQ